MNQPPWPYPSRAQPEPPAQPAQPERPERPEQRWHLLAVLSLWLCCLALDNTKLVVALPTLARSFGVDQAALRWVVEAYLLVYTSLLLLGGALSERFGPRRMLLAGALIFGGGSAAAASADSIGALVCFRSVMGVGGALLTPACLATIKHRFPAHERARAIAVWTASFGVGAAAGPVLSGWLLERYPWGSIMVANVPLAAVIFAGAARYVPRDLPRRVVPLDLAGAALALSGGASLVYALLEGPYLGWGDRSVLGAMGGAGLLVAALLAWERRSAHPMLDLSLFRRPRFRAALSVILLGYLSFSGVSFVLAQYLQLVRGYGPLESGLFTVPLAAAMLGGTLLAPCLVRRLGEERALVVSLTTAGAGAALLAHASLDARDALSLCLAEVLSGAGSGATFANATDMVIGSVPAARAGSAGAINETAFELGGVLGVAVLGTLQAKMNDGAAGPATARAMAAGAGALAVALLMAWSAMRAHAARVEAGLS